MSSTDMTSMNTHASADTSTGPAGAGGGAGQQRVHPPVAGPGPGHRLDDVRAAFHRDVVHHHQEHAPLSRPGHDTPEPLSSTWRVLSFAKNRYDPSHQWPVLRRWLESAAPVLAAAAAAAGRAWRGAGAVMVAAAGGMSQATIATGLRQCGQAAMAAGGCPLPSGRRGSSS